MHEVLLIILGVLLGIFVPKIQDIIQAPYKKDELLNLTNESLKSIRTRLVLNSFAIIQNEGKLTHDFIKMCVENIENDEHDESAQKNMANFKKFLEWTPEKLKNYNEHLKLKKKGFDAVRVKKINPKSLEISLRDSSLLNSWEKRKLLEINERISLFNQTVDENIQFIELSFNSQSMEHRSNSIERNIKMCQELFPSFSQGLIKEINLFLNRK